MAGLRALEGVPRFQLLPGERRAIERELEHLGTLLEGFPEDGSFLRRRTEARLREVEMELPQLDRRERRCPARRAG